jgi:hypothetical protein
MNCLRNGYFAFHIVWMGRAGSCFLPHEVIILSLSQLVANFTTVPSPIILFSERIIIKLFVMNYCVNPLNAESNPICHLLVLLGDLTFTGPCIVSTFQYTSNKMQRCTVYLYVETAPRVLGCTFTHHRERI